MASWIEATKVIQRRAFRYLCLANRGVTKSVKRWLKRRSAIESVIGHMQQSHGLATNRLKGKVGDQINALSAAIA